MNSYHKLLSLKILIIESNNIKRYNKVVLIYLFLDITVIISVKGVFIVNNDSFKNIKEGEDNMECITEQNKKLSDLSLHINRLKLNLIKIINKLDTPNKENNSIDKFEALMIEYYKYDNEELLLGAEESILLGAEVERLEEI